MKYLWLCQNVSDDKNDKLSEKILSGLETIDDETDSSDMLLVKVSEIEEAREEFGESVIGNDLPSLVFFDDKVPTKFDGRLRNLHLSRYNYFWYITKILLPLYWLYNILEIIFCITTGDLLEEADVLDWLKAEAKDQDQPKEAPKADKKAPEEAPKPTKTKKSSDGQVKKEKSKSSAKEAEAKATTASMPSEDAKTPKSPSAGSPPKKPAKPVKAKKASQPSTASVKTEQPRINETSNGNIRRDT